MLPFYRGKMRLLVFLGWAWVLFGVAKSDDPLAGRLGSDVLLDPNVTAEITSITWKQGPNLAVQWDGADINFYRQFKQRSSLDIKTGVLTIKDLVLSDSNDYTPEINNVLQSKIVLKVYRPVTQPTVARPNENDRCVFTCGGDTTDAEPVTYSWTKDKAKLPETSREINQMECCYIYTCTMTNPVSTMESEPFDPCSKPWVPALGVSGGLVGLVVAVVLIHRLLAGVWFFQKDSKCWKADFWKKSTDQSGSAKDKGETIRMANDNN